MPLSQWIVEIMRLLEDETAEDPAALEDLVDERDTHSESEVAEGKEV